MKRNIFIIALLSLAFCKLSGQDINQITEDGTITVKSHNNNNDSTRSGKKIVPKGVKTWTIDQRFGDRTEIVSEFKADVDTSAYNFMNSIYTQGNQWQYNFLGNLGSPRTYRIYHENSDVGTFFFDQPYGYFNTPIEDFNFVNTLSPITNLSYNTCGNRTNGEDHLTIRFDANANKRLGIGALMDYIYGRGYYQYQNSSHLNTSLFGSYIGNRYQAHWIARFNHQKVSENGGIIDDKYITHPESFNDDYSENEIPTQLSQNWNRYDSQHLYFNHRYALTPDSTKHLLHTLQLSHNRRIYQAYYTPENFYLNDYQIQGKFSGDSIYDKTSNFQIQNLVGVSLQKETIDTKLYTSYKYQHFFIPTTDGGREKHSEHSFFVGGTANGNISSVLNYNIDAELGVAGDDKGEFALEGGISRDFLIKGKNINFSATAHLERTSAVFYHEHHHSRHAWWDNEDFDFSVQKGIDVAVDIPHIGTMLKMAYSNISDHTYLATTYEHDDDGNRINHSFAIRQAAEQISIFDISLRQHINLRPFYCDIAATYQHSNNDIIALPAFNLYANLYVHFKMAKVLDCNLGAETLYFTEYRAPVYAPYIGQFAYYEGEADKSLDIGNYPFVNVYANFNLKHIRLFVKYDHVNKGWGNSRYFLTPHYPTNGRVLRFGLSWNLFN